MSSILTRAGALTGLAIAAAVVCGSGSIAVAQDWEAEMKKIHEAARTEGELVVFARRYDEVMDAFDKKYPGIKVVTVTGRGSELGQRIIAEQRAGQYLVDLYLGGPYTVASMLIPGETVDTINDKLVLPEVTDGSKWIGGKLRYTDPDRKYNIAFLANSGASQIHYNTSMVNPSEFDSWQDLLDPKWKGKIVSLEPQETFIGGTVQVMYFHKDLGPDYMRKLFLGQDVTFAKNNRQMTDWLAQGRYSLCIGCLHVEQAMAQGLPLNIFPVAKWKEGAYYLAGSGTISLIKNAPNPNAAKLFINWFLSREGQIAMQNYNDRGEHQNSGRIDIPKDIVSADNRLVDGMTYSDQNAPEWSDTEAMTNFAKQLMAERLSK